MTDTETRAGELRAELNALAPCPNEGPVTAKALARYLLMEAQVTWEWNWVSPARPGPGLVLDATRLHLMGAHFAAAHALLTLAWVDEGIADAAAEEIRDAWDDGGLIGHWLGKHLGDDLEPIADLGRDLAEATVKPAEQAGVLVDPEDLRALVGFARGVGQKTPWQRALVERMSAATGVTTS